MSSRSRPSVTAYVTQDVLDALLAEAQQLGISLSAYLSVIISRRSAL